MTPDWPRVMAAYNRWMNTRIYALLLDVPDAERKRDRGAFFASIHGTLNHLLFGDLMWMARFEALERPHLKMGEIIHEDFAVLRAARAEMDTRIVAWADALDPAWLAGPFEYRSGIDGRARRLPAWVLVTHMFNHQTHHRGQLTTLMFQIGIDPDVTDLPWLPGLGEGGLVQPVGRIRSEAQSAAWGWAAPAHPAGHAAL